MKLAGKTDIGNQRSENQDNFRAGREADDTVWAIVCDGMGGARGGKLASSIASEHLENIFTSDLLDMDTTEKIRAFIIHSIRAANEAVYNKAETDEALSGMGTTLVCAIVKNDCVYYAHIGDSRLYILRDTELIQLTKDHSIVQELVEQGSITESEAFLHPRKNLITRALGVQTSVEIDYAETKVLPGDKLLLCTDGLTNCVSNNEIANIMLNTDFFDYTSTLINRALELGGQDNITVVVLEVEQTVLNTEDNNG